jgi:hypothetical protein
METRHRHDLRPVFRTLDADAITALLKRNHVGRLAFTLHDRVDIQPVHYVYDAGWLYGRTEPGTKLSTIAHHPWVAFEVDETAAIFDWESVVVHGKFEILEDQWHTPEVIAHAKDLLRILIPETLQTDDPVPFRTVLFRVYLSQATGRSCHVEPVPHG